MRAAAKARTAVLGEPSELVGMSYFTDASLIVPRYPLPTVILGPGEVEFAHKADESIDLDYVHLASKIYFHTAVEYFAEANS